MDTLAKRMMWARQRTQPLMTQHELAKKSGVAQSTIGNLESGTRKSARNLAVIATLLNVSPYWLETGKGSPEPVANEHSNVEALAEIGRIPLISWVTAGNLCGVEDPYPVGDAEEWLSCPVKHGPHTYALRIRGESMHNPGGSPSFSDGEVIFVDPDREFMHRSLVIARIENDHQATFKRLLIDGDKRFLEALNPSWPNRIFEITQNASICGVIIVKMQIFI